jgi:acetylornithine deacetylase/succinyl-diaminopimelate desuccinylase-like protein
VKRSWTTERLVRELIAIPSVNPAFVPVDCPYAGEQAVADFLAARAANLGLPIEFQEVLPHRPNLLTRLSPGGKTRHRIVLAPHLDTVGGPGDWEVLFRPVKRHGRIYGRGACDTKGSVAAMFTALARVALKGHRPASTEIVFLGLVDEENAQLGSRAVARKGLRADLAVVGEPTQLRVVTAHKGDIWLRLETQGKSAHGSRPELGRNAVHEMAKVVHLLETDYAAQLRRRRHPILGRPTVNVGSIGGGTQPNIVPDKCFITVDRRTLPGETDAQVRQEIAGLLRRARLQASLSSAREVPCAALESSRDVPLVRAFLDAAGQRNGHGVDYFCDAAVLAQGGIPSVVFGPGDIAQAHTVGEWIEAKSLETATDFLERFLRSLP